MSAAVPANRLCENCQQPMVDHRAVAGAVGSQGILLCPTAMFKAAS